MNESVEQAITVGINGLIFVIALSISLNLMFSVRNLASVAAEVNDAVKDGSVTVSSQDDFDIKISGYEVISYYCNYIKPYYVYDNQKVYNHNDIDVTIKIGSNEYKRESSGNDLWEETRFTTFKNSIDLDAEYRINMIEHIENGVTKVLIEEV